MLTRKLKSRVLLALFSSVMAAPGLAHAEMLDVVMLFAKAKAAGEMRMARKTKAVDVRVAHPGEIVTTIIKGEGVETRSKPAEAGDFVVRNRCPETGDEEYLVKAAKFASRYTDSGKARDAMGWKEYLPQGKDMNFWIVPAGHAPFEFTAPWGEKMVAKPGDAIVQTPDDEKDTYRIAAASFSCAYTIVETP